MSASFATAQKPRISDRICKKIHETIAVSPVTIIVGPTGCGKSTQVPPALLLDPSLKDGPILCTQPRRLAVVAVATRVAQERGVPLGGTEVGYHVGQSNHSQSGTKLLFSTAGILLEELRALGVSALAKYKVVVIDECHERSPESDLVLALVRSLLQAHPNKNIRIVLMSATFDHGRYQRYFADIPGCERIENISLETASSFESYYDSVQTFYLEDAIDMLPDADTFDGLRRTMRLNPGLQLAGVDNGKTLSAEMLRLIRLLIVHHHESEPLDGVFVIFAPTYRQLEQIYYMLRYQTVVDRWKLGVLHSSIDIEFCLESMRANKDKGFRKILLASAIADSSVTIPGVTCVIDLCRALEVRWDSSKMMRIPKTVWASKSICEQRKGRTGRTCPGKVFRLVPKGFYISSFASWEVPQLTISPCRDEALKLLCAGMVKDVSQVLAQCLDPPPPLVIEQALKYLVRIGACVQGPKNRMIASETGLLMAALPFQVEQSRIILAGAKRGLLNETLTLCAITSHKPAPLVHHFGNTERNAANAMKYFPSVQANDPASMNMANLSAFFYYDHYWNDRRLIATTFQFCYASLSRWPHNEGGEHVAEFGNEGHDSEKMCCNVWKWTPALEEKHIKWCEKKCINPTSVRGISELIDSTLAIFYSSKYEPEWLKSANPTPQWRRYDDWEGDAFSVGDMLYRVYGEEKDEYLIASLTALLTNQSEAASKHLMLFSGQAASRSEVPMQREIPIACVHFLQGRCTYGSRCRNSHSLHAVRPPCRFFKSGTCAKGDDCIYSHTVGSSNLDEIADIDSLQSVVPIIPSLLLQGGALQWFADNRRELLILGEGNFEFTRSLIKLGICPSFSSDTETALSELGAAQILTVDATRMHFNARLQALVASASIRKFAWNFPFTGIEENDEIHESLILGTFLSLNVLFSLAMSQMTVDHLSVEIAFTLQGDQFSRWMVLRSASRMGWHLTKWGDFDSEDYPGYHPRRANRDKFPESSSRFYVFTRKMKYYLLL